MIEQFVDLLIGKQILETERKDEYVYVLTLLVERTITYGFLIVIAIMLHQLLLGIIFLVSFLLLRRTTGGFHSSTYIGCLLGTIALFFLSLKVIVPLLQQWHWLGIGISVIAVIAILVLAPVNHPNLCLTEEEIRLHKKWCLLVLGIECCLVVIAYLLGCYWQQYIQAGVLDCAVLVIIAKIIRQEVTINEKDKS